MKSRHRPPLNLTVDADAAETAPGAAATEAPAVETGLDIVDPLPAPEAAPAAEAAPDRARPERPLSERRRRRLADARRQADLDAARKAEAEAAATPTAAPAEFPPEPEPESVDPTFKLAVSAEAPPVVTQSRTPSTPVIRREPVPSGRTGYLIAGLGAALWAGGVAAWVAYSVGAGLESLGGLTLALYVLMALAPAGLMLMLAHAARHASVLAAESRRARQMAEAMTAPTALAAGEAGNLLISLRGDIDHATLAATRAREEMALLREALAQETSRLNDAAEIAGRTARRLSEQLGGEREQLLTLGGRLESQTASVIEAVSQQSRMVVDASDLAQAQLREAEAALAARAADMAAAAGEAQDAARVAADDLSRQTLRLENAGAGVSEQIRSVEEGLSQQRAALVTAAYALRTDQEDFSAQLESQRAQFTEHLSTARTTASSLDDTASQAVDALREVVEAAADQFRALVEMSQREADGFDNATKISLDRFEALAAEARDTLMEETRRSLEALKAAADESRASAADAAGEAQRRADRLGEAVFEASRLADQAADARIAGARRVVDDTVSLVDQAAEQATERLETAVERLNAVLAQVDESIAEVDQRASRLPAEAEARVEAVRRTVEEGLQALAAASRKAAEDTEALDAGFQERVRRNYDMLTEAVRLMGVVSGDSPVTRRGDGVQGYDAPPSRPARSDEGGERGLGLRGRLKLEPTEPQARPRPGPDDQLGWNDLVNISDADPAPLDLSAPSMPPSMTPAEAEALSDRITAAIRRMGVDPNALLPRSRVAEAARAVAQGDPDAARQIVRRVAPAAVRSVSRRVLADPDLKGDAELYVRGVAGDLTASARRGDVDGVLARLTSDAGRAFMLLDAAIGDLA